MNRQLRSVVVPLMVAFVGLTAVPADAARPASGKITKTKKSVKWSGTPPVAGLSNPFPLQSGLPAHCTPEEFCDHYLLKVNLGEGARVEVKIVASRPNPTSGYNCVDGDDYDLFVYDPTGKQMPEFVNSPAGVEKGVFKHKKKFNNKNYTVQVEPWCVLPDSTYKGTAKALTVGK